jgi:REP element-mobilizing transposase RayT
MSLDPAHAADLYAYIGGILKNKSCHLYKINGTENHVHILTDLHPSVAVADYMREIKASSSKWIKENGKFPVFTGWSEGYGAFTCSYMDLGSIIDYIRNQREHHASKNFEEEYRSLLRLSGIEPDEKYFP